MADPDLALLDHDPSFGGAIAALSGFEIFLVAAAANASCPANRAEWRIALAVAEQITFHRAVGWRDLNFYPWATMAVAMSHGIGADFLLVDAERVKQLAQLDAHDLEAAHAASRDDDRPSVRDSGRAAPGPSI